MAGPTPYMATNYIVIYSIHNLLDAGPHSKSLAEVKLYKITRFHEPANAHSLQRPPGYSLDGALYLLVASIRTDRTSQYIWK